MDVSRGGDASLSNAVTRALRPWKLLAVLPHFPIPLLGLMLAGSSVQASCNGSVDSGYADGGPDATLEDATSEDAPSDDSPADRADGMSYGDAYVP